MLIRKATAEDAEPIARCLLLAMEDIVYQFISEKNPEKARRFMLHFAAREMNQYSYENCWVAEKEKQVVAAVNVYNGALLYQLRQPVIEYIRSNYNGNFQPEDETEAGEYYIDSLGVEPAQQCKGIGASLLQLLVKNFVNEGHKTLGLLVDDSNPAAKKLYLKLGFKSAGHKSIFGKDMEHLQIKEPVANATPQRQ
jgi:ribosomal protein S18 acetylase RimI-like enzyme